MKNYLYSLEQVKRLHGSKEDKQWLREALANSHPTEENRRPLIDFITRAVAKSPNVENGININEKNLTTSEGEPVMGLFSPEHRKIDISGPLMRDINRSPLETIIHEGTHALAKNPVTGKDKLVQDFDNVMQDFYKNHYPNLKHDPDNYNPDASNDDISMQNYGPQMSNILFNQWFENGVGYSDPRREIGARIAPDLFNKWNAPTFPVENNNNLQDVRDQYNKSMDNLGRKVLRRTMKGIQNSYRDNGLIDNSTKVPGDNLYSYNNNPVYNYQNDHKDDGKIDNEFINKIENLRKPEYLRKDVALRKPKQLYAPPEPFNLPPGDVLQQHQKEWRYNKFAENRLRPPYQEDLYQNDQNQQQPILPQQQIQVPNYNVPLPQQNVQPTNQINSPTGSLSPVNSYTNSPINSPINSPKLAKGGVVRSESTASLLARAAEQTRRMKELQERQRLISRPAPKQQKPTFADLMRMRQYLDSIS